MLLMITVLVYKISLQFHHSFESLSTSIIWLVISNEDIMSLCHSQENRLTQLCKVVRSAYRKNNTLTSIFLQLAWKIVNAPAVINSISASVSTQNDAVGSYSLLVGKNNRSNTVMSMEISKHEHNISLNNEIKENVLVFSVSPNLQRSVCDLYQQYNCNLSATVFCKRWHFHHLGFVCEQCMQISFVKPDPH